MQTHENPPNKSQWCIQGRRHEVCAPHQISAFTHQFYAWSWPHPLPPSGPPLQLSLLISIYMISVVNITGLWDNGRVEHLLTLGQQHRGRLGNSPTCAVGAGRWRWTLMGELNPLLWGGPWLAPRPAAHSQINGGHWQKGIMWRMSSWCSIVSLDQVLPPLAHNAGPDHKKRR